MVENKALYKQAVKAVRSKSKGKTSSSAFEVTINFHPDRLTESGQPLLVAICNDMRIKSQFETGTSNGGLTAYSGGDRWKWEQDVFDGVYDNCSPRQRPKYGALNYKRYEYGAAPRFGSAFFRLKPHVIERTTFCYPDSFFEPSDFATSGHLARLIELASSDTQDELDDYIEAHIHGELNLYRDVDAIVLDPCYAGSAIEEQARELPLELHWHSGFEVSVETIEKHAGYRGQEYVELARKVANGQYITPKLLGKAESNRNYEQQDIKKVWHYLARFGQAKACGHRCAS